MPHIECVKNNGKPYLRLAESRYVKDIGRQKKFELKNLGPLSKFDDGKPDFLKRFREKFKNGEIDFDGITYYSNLPTKRVFEIDNEMNYIELKNIGFLFLQSIYNSLGIYDLLREIKSNSKLEYDLNGLTKLLVFGRILDPASKKKTFENVLENDVDEMNLGKIVVVADNGMNTQENKYLIVDKCNGYIVSKSVKRSWKSQRDWALSDENYTYIRNASNGVVFKYKSRINEITLIYKNEDGTNSKKTVKEKEIIYWSKKHYEKELHQNQKFIEYLESCKENPDKLKDRQRKSQEYIKVLDIDKDTGEVIKTDKIVVFLDQKLEKYKETLGYYSIVTSEIEDNDTEIINRYHGLSRIEDSFRIIKSDLEGRPIYVWAEEHIKAHFLICFIALTIIRIIQYWLLKYENKSTLNVDGWEQGITADKIKQALNNFKACSDKNGTCLISTLDIQIEKIIKFLGIEMLNLTTIDKIDKFKNQLNKDLFM